MKMFFLDKNFIEKFNGKIFDSDFFEETTGKSLFAVEDGAQKEGKSDLI